MDYSAFELQDPVTTAIGTSQGIGRAIVAGPGVRQAESSYLSGSLHVSNPADPSARSTAVTMEHACSFLILLGAFLNAAKL